MIVRSTRSPQRGTRTIGAATATKSAKPPVTQKRVVNANTSITSGVQRRSATQATNPQMSAIMASLSPEKRKFVDQIRKNCKGSSAILGATNTTNIMVKPDFLSLLPLFVQKLLVLDVYGSVPMNSRQQLIPYFKVLAENDKGETHAQDILNSPMVNQQGKDPNFGGRVVKNEVLENVAGAWTTAGLIYTPVLPGSVAINTTLGGVSTVYTDDGSGYMVDGTGAQVGTIAYDLGTVTWTAPVTLADGDTVTASVYQYDNENVGPNENGEYGAKMGKIYLQEDEFSLKATAHQLASYWSIYSAFAAQTEWGTNIAEMSKEAAFSELTAEINRDGFNQLKAKATYKPQFNFSTTPIESASVYPTDYMNMFLLNLKKAAASIYDATELSRPNRLIVGTNVESYLSMIKGYTADNTENTVGPYHAGKLDQFEVYVDPKYDPSEWVMACKNDDIRRNSGLFGEYMPFTNTDPIGLANMSVQQGFATMYAMEVVNPATVVKGRLIGNF